MDKPVILGGKKIFDENIYIVRPSFKDIADKKLMAEIKAILDSNMVTRGSRQNALEEQVAEYLGVKNVVAMSNCTLALTLGIQAAGLRGKEIALPSFTISATVNAAYWNNCKIKFIDIDQETLNMSVEDLKSKVSKDTAAIMPVHVFGNPNNIDELQKVADENQATLLFDAAQAFGSKYKGKRIGSFGELEIISGSPTKHFSTAEGGFVVTNDDKIAETVRLTRNYGVEPNYNTLVVGLCARMPEINAAIGLSMLPHIEDYIENRNNYAEKFRTALKSVPGLSYQKINPDGHSCFNYFGVIVDEEKFGMNNKQLYSALNADGIYPKIYYHPPVHKHTAYKEFNSLSLPETEFVCDNIICLPFYNEMSDELIEGISTAVKRIHENAEEVKGAL